MKIMIIQMQMSDPNKKIEKLEQEIKKKKKIILQLRKKKNKLL